MSRQTVNALETGKYDLSLLLAFKIACLFGTTIEDLFTPDPAALALPVIAPAGRLSARPAALTPSPHRDWFPAAAASPARLTLPAAAGGEYRDA